MKQWLNQTEARLPYNNILTGFLHDHFLFSFVNLNKQVCYKEGQVSRLNWGELLSVKVLKDMHSDLTVSYHSPVFQN